MLTFLVIDDSSVIRKVARRILQEMNYLVEEASDADEALYLCGQSMPQAIIVDWKLPDMLGVDFIREFKSRFAEEGRKTAIIYCSSEMDIPAMTQAKRAGANQFLLKPFDAEIVRRKLAEAGFTGASAVAA